MKSLKSLSLFLLILITSCSSDIDDNLGIKPIFGAQSAIPADSDLFENLKDITTDNERPDKSIVCIDFIYPITLFVFDENEEFLYTSTLSDDDEFSAFLEPIESSYSISISFPITSILDSGEELIIENKEELKESIDTCLNIERIGECETILRECLWKVGYSFEGDNTYLGNIMQESDGFLTLNTEENIVVGSWTPLVIENELHININVVDTTAIGDYFNFDWKAEYIDANSLKLTFEDRELILNQRCDPDFADCDNFNFEVCETESGNEIGDFILNDYTYCIFDTLEFDNEDDNFSISYYETEEDAIALLNPINSEETYNNIELNQTIYVRINDIENNIQYYIPITLSVISC
ncbi:hypothetical protein [Winogradskyella sp. PE311]|uniref:hypothetical protein n=1 Tax=Winogradskyella sp. PE311 TaxID=3366943 RepID=UPI00397FC734